MVIYTKRGDRGKTSLYDKTSGQRKRMPKDSLRASSLGAIDELNSYLGVVISSSEDMALNKKLKDIQNNLLTIGSLLAGSSLRFFKTNTRRLEKEIDEMEGELPVLANFILPGGSKIASNLQYARTLARKAERRLVTLNEEKKVKTQVLTYINRLSDYLFTLARDINYKMEIKDEVWVGRKK